MQIIHKTQVDYTFRDIFEDRDLQQMINFVICQMILFILVIGNLFGFIEIEPLPDEYMPFGIVCWFIVLLAGFGLIIDLRSKYE